MTSTLTRIARTRYWGLYPHTWCFLAATIADLAVIVLLLLGDR